MKKTIVACAFALAATTAHAALFSGGDQADTPYPQLDARSAVSLAVKFDKALVDEKAFLDWYAIHTDCAGYLKNDDEFANPEFFEGVKQAIRADEAGVGTEYTINVPLKLGKYLADKKTFTNLLNELTGLEPKGFSLRNIWLPRDVRKQELPKDMFKACYKRLNEKDLGHSALWVRKIEFSRKLDFSDVDISRADAKSLVRNYDRKACIRIRINATGFQRDPQGNGSGTLVVDPVGFEIRTNPTGMCAGETVYPKNTEAQSAKEYVSASIIQNTSMSAVMRLADAVNASLDKSVEVEGISIEGDRCDTTPKGLPATIGPGEHYSAPIDNHCSNPQGVKVKINDKWYEYAL